MAKNRWLVMLALMLATFVGQSQTVELNGVVIAGTDVENIHVINKTSNTFTTTNSLGGFKIRAKVADTIVFSSVQYKLKAIAVSFKQIKERSVVVHLVDNVNVLDEIIVGKVLTGDLDSDVNNSDEERPIDFYDVGIPGYKGKPKTQSERRLHEADHGKYVSIGLGVGLNLNKILNAISGRTKKLKKRVRLESNDALMSNVNTRISNSFFNIYPLEEKLRQDFFYFCTDDPNFEKRCKNKSDLEIFEYLAEKIVEYKSNLTEKKD